MSCTKEGRDMGVERKRVVYEDVDEVRKGKRAGPR